MAFPANTTGGIRGGAFMGSSTGRIIAIGDVHGCLAALNPALWATLFTSDPLVERAADDYLSIAGFGFAAYGFGLCLYFSSQGSGRILGPVLGGTVRLLVVLIGGMLLMQQGGDFRAFAVLVTMAMVAYGTATGLFVWRTRWGAK